MIASVLIPSRCRPDGLRRTIESVKASAFTVDYEILVRLDADDPAVFAVVEEWRGDPLVRVFVGPRCNGYESLNSVFYKELEARARGDWCWIMNDDAVLVGEDWDVKLAKVPAAGFIVQPEVEQLNDSVYPRNDCTGFPIYPRLIWKTLGMPDYPDPCDAVLPPFLLERGWKTHFLDGITVHHQRGTEAEQTEHRR